MKHYIVEDESGILSEHCAEGLRELKKSIESYDHIYQRIGEVSGDMRIYPVDIKIKHKSGRTEVFEIKKDLERWQHDLSAMHKSGTVIEYSISTFQDRRFGGIS